MCTRFYVRVHVRVCSLGLFSVVSLIMRKPFNVCLPVERGRERETVIAEWEWEKNLSEGARQTLLLMQYDLSDNDTHISLASTRAGTYIRAQAGGARLSLCVTSAM